MAVQGRARSLERGRDDNSLLPLRVSGNSQIRATPWKQKRLSLQIFLFLMGKRVRSRAPDSGRAIFDKFVQHRLRVEGPHGPQAALWIDYGLLIMDE